MRAYADNVVIVLDPLPEKSRGGIDLVHDQKKLEARGSRSAKVVASGPGYYTDRGTFVPNEVKPGERVIVDALAGQNYALDLSIPRHNKNSEFQALFGERGEFRIVREQEILGVLVEGEAEL